MKQAILLISETGLDVARTISRELHNAPIYTQKNVEGCHTVSSFDTFLQEHFAELDALIHVGALGICVRHIAPYVKNKYKDPAVVCVDSTGRFAVPVLSGHIGGANELAEQIAQMMGGEAVVTTQSDNTDLWALDTLGKKYDWQTPQSRASMNKCIYHFVERRPTALLLDIRDRGTAYLERTCPAHVKIFYRYEDIAFEQFALLITVSPWIHHAPIDTLEFHPRVLRLGVGCRKDAHPEGIAAYISDKLEAHGLSPLSLAGIATIELKKDEPLLPALQSAFPHTDLQIFRPDDLRDIEIPNPSEKVLTTTGVAGVAETTAIRAANYGPLVLEKQKGEVTEGNQFTFAVAMDAASLRQGHIEIVGAGPGDPELISVRGRHFLEQADLILYAGSLVPKELTFCAKEGAKLLLKFMTTDEALRLYMETTNGNTLPYRYSMSEVEQAALSDFQVSKHEIVTDELIYITNKNKYPLCYFGGLTEFSGDRSNIDVLLAIKEDSRRLTGEEMYLREISAHTESSFRNMLVRAGLA